jgi:ABC-2 type transport system permease protein
MRKIWAIAKKELSIYFTTVIGYSCFAGFALLLGYLFLQFLQNFIFQSQTYLKARNQGGLATLNLNDLVITPTYYNALILFLFMVPFLTMRLLAEEKRMKTFELLMTVPTTPLQIVLGKYLAAVAMIGVICSIALIHPLLLSTFATGTFDEGGIEWSSVFMGVGGVFMMGCAFVALGLCASAATESQIVAAFLSFVGLLLWWMMGVGAQGAEGWWRDFLKYLAPPTHVEGALKGLFVTEDLIFFVTAIAAWLFLCHRIVESNRWR